MAYTTIIGAGDLRTLVDRGQVVVIDCGFDLADPGAGRRQFEKGHIPGGRYLHLDEDLSAPASRSEGRHPLPDPETLARALRGAGVNAGRQVVAYDDQGGPYAARLWWLLRWLGHDAVAVLDGGEAAWIEAGYSLEPGLDAEPAAGDFRAEVPDRARVVDVAEVVASLGDPHTLIVDARSAARFRGAPDALDAVAGHIPGARNRFFKDNLDAAGRFKPAETLRDEFAAVLGAHPAEEVVLQCGSGVTACHNALAMEVAGLPGARLYAGSWSQWIGDPARPVATGDEAA